VSGTLVHVANTVCWGIVVLVWVAGAAYNAFRAPRGHARTEGRLAIVAVVAVLVLVAWAGHGYWHDVDVRAPWLRLVGLAVLVASTAFTLWARLSLGTMWSPTPTLKEGHALRTHGPYAVTRHPIYTGLLGMLLGSTLLSGIGSWIVVFPAAVVALEVRIRVEERLMLATFPDEYPGYRRQVPQLVPRLSRRTPRP
jgi:protein-S-isoprenylcysteine O-methyltransferase Ste14